MPPGQPAFGEELRRRRYESDQSLAQLAKKVHISRSYLSKIEGGKAKPGGKLARLLDSRLNAGGQLVALLAPPPQRSTPAPEPTGSGAWSLRLHADGASDFTSGDPATLAAGGPPSVVAHCVIAPGLPEETPVEEALPVFQTLFHEYRRLGQCCGPAVVIPLSGAATAALRGLVHGAPPAQRGVVLRLAARFAEYTGWMWQEAGDDRAARCWTDQTVQLAEAGGDRELAAYALLRQAELALYQGDSLATVELARAATARAHGRRLRELAAQREAQGHALLGDENACRRALDRGAELAGGSGLQGDGSPALGGTHLPDLTAFVRAWCLHELGDPEAAVALLDTGRESIAPYAVRARARHDARLALALAGAGRVERACEVAESVARDVMATDSATVRSDVRQLRSALTTRSKHPAVRDALPVIAASLRGAPGAGTGHR
ncbi:helix-turn-helix transcriptional regulator [Streptomyces sp. MUM 16J]|uniref:helix-turn-helix domain-containing protein n=1 Tax=Streptomyces sp. MUM 16J TaxID=2791988 RepID=UPI000583591A|nr:helix-turn-helix transcriptional regulator [Streptomyces sp. MUM 16J]MCH0556687.1 helix-turn-helix transcriptional regulator [Streptomyces sp. MUM 16J]